MTNHEAILPILIPIMIFCHVVDDCSANEEVPILCISGEAVRKKE